MKAESWSRGLAIVTLGGLVITGCVASLLEDKTVGERFEVAMKKLAEHCAKNLPKPGNTDCDPLKLKPADPLSTEEGRFASSILIPNPLPQDSGYKPGMTSQEYFEHLCKTEAGEFIFKTVEGVDGIMQMRPRTMATDYELQHLYALEDPYGASRDESILERAYVNPSYSHSGKDGYKLYKPDQNYKFLEKPIVRPQEQQSDVPLYVRYTRPNTDKLILENDLYLYPRDQQPKLLEEQIREPNSRYGFTWRGVTRPHDREMGIAGGEWIILDIRTSEVLGVRRGYLRTGNVRETGGRVWWLGAHSCPSNLPGVTEAFIHRVLKPSRSVN
jgi:hypothetical protein